jgi:hypothetical protein
MTVFMTMQKCQANDFSRASALLQSGVHARIDLYQSFAI